MSTFSEVTKPPRSQAFYNFLNSKDSVSSDSDRLLQQESFDTQTIVHWQKRALQAHATHTHTQIFLQITSQRGAPWPPCLVFFQWQILRYRNAMVLQASVCLVTFGQAYLPSFSTLHMTCAEQSSFGVSAGCRKFSAVHRTRFPKVEETLKKLQSLKGTRPSHGKSIGWKLEVNPLN